MPIPTASGDFAAFLTTELLPSIPNVRGSGSSANSAEQRNEYVLPTVSQLAAWRAVFQSLVAGAWESAQQQAQLISSTYNVVQFLDTRTGRTYYVLMEGVPGQIPAPVDHPSGSVTIADPTDPARRGWGTYVFDAQPQRALSFSAPHPHDDLETEIEAVEAFLALRARTLLIAGADRDQNTAQAPCDQSSRPYLEADVSHTAESVFQMAFEEIYSSDAFTWHLQFHGNANPTLACQDVDVFLSNGVEAAPDTLYRLSANIATASTAAAAGGPVLVAGVYDAPGDCSTLASLATPQPSFTIGKCSAFDRDESCSIISNGLRSMRLSDTFKIASPRDNVFSLLFTILISKVGKSHSKEAHV